MASKSKILVVEDNSDLRRLYAIGLNRSGYEVKLASNGAEAIERVAEERPDLILLDVLMPIMDGWEVLERVNPSDQPAIPVIVISGQPFPTERSANHAVCAWLNKPITIEELVTTINDRLSTAHAIVTN